MRKSNWSDLLSALAISERDNVRRLLESAMMKALAVISEINTTVVASVRQQPLSYDGVRTTYSHKLCRTESGLFTRSKGEYDGMTWSIPSAAIILTSTVQTDSKGRVNVSYFDIGITLHDLLDSGERERRVAIIRSFLLG